MAGTYGQAGVTYGQSGNTYGNFATTTPATGRRHRGSDFLPPRIEPARQVIFRSGELVYRVTFHGTGVLKTGSTLTVTPTLEPVEIELAGTVSVETRQTRTLEATGTRTVCTRLAGTPVEFRAEHRIETETRVALTRIIDPPELWDLLDLPELM